jgi:hypothetical protein
MREGKAAANPTSPHRHRPVIVMREERLLTKQGSVRNEPEAFKRSPAMAKPEAP